MESICTCFQFRVQFVIKLQWFCSLLCFGWLFFSANFILFYFVSFISVFSFFLFRFPIYLFCLSIPTYLVSRVFSTFIFPFYLSLFIYILSSFFFTSIYATYCSVCFEFQLHFYAVRQQQLELCIFVASYFEAVQSFRLTLHPPSSERMPPTPTVSSILSSFILILPWRCQLQHTAKRLNSSNLQHG